MKNKLTLLCFVFISTWTYGQIRYQDTVYLKDGKIILGKITERIPKKLIKISSDDNNIYVYRMDEIAKIARQKSNPDKTPNSLENRKGYVGMSVGASIPLGDFEDRLIGHASNGLQLNLFNFGYLFSDNIGIATTWFGASNPIGVKNIDPWEYGALMVGPLLSIPAAESVDLDFKPMIGYSVTTLPNIGYGPEQSGAFAFSIGTQLRFHIGRIGSIILSADYFSTHPEFIYPGIDQNITAITFGLGVVFRLK